MWSEPIQGCEPGGFYSIVEDSDLLGCDTLSSDWCFMMFSRIIVQCLHLQGCSTPQSLNVKALCSFRMSQYTNSLVQCHPRRPESSIVVCGMGSQRNQESSGVHDNNHATYLSFLCTGMIPMPHSSFASRSCQTLLPVWILPWESLNLTLLP